MAWFYIIIFVPFLFAFFIPYIHKLTANRIHTGWFVLFVPLLLFFYLQRFVPAIANGKTFVFELPWIPSLNINFTFYIDGLALLFSLLITGIGALVISYSIFYLAKEREALHNFYVYILFFMGSMLGLVLSDNLLVLYVFWELTSISSFLLIAYWYQRKNSRYGAQKSLLITIFGGLAMLAGLIILSIMTDTYSFREILNKISELKVSPLYIPAMILILLGAFTKSAQFPFSIWLPAAMEAPTPVSAYLHSATMVKAGIYLVARFTPIFGGSSEWFWIVSSIGMITLIYGSVNAVNQKDLKALLAYSTISQLGLIMSLFGIGSATLFFEQVDQSTVYAFAVLAAIFHLINHSTFKGCLFMVVGIIDHETGTRDIRKLGGLMSLMPVSFTLATIGGFAMAGFPPFNGFLSKEMFFTGVLNVWKFPVFGTENFGVIFVIIAWVSSVFTFIYCMILVLKTFVGKHHPEKLDKKVREAPLGMLIPPIILAVFVVVIFFFPNAVSNYFLQPALIAVLPEFTDMGGLPIEIKAWHGWNTEVLMTIGVIGLGGLLYYFFTRWSFIYRFFPQALTLNHLYQQMLARMEAVSLKVTNGYMTGSIRGYFVYIFSFFILILGYALWLSNGISFNPSNDASIHLYEGGAIVLMVITVFTVVLAKSRVTAIIALGVLGYLVALFYVIFRAPDLALTQLVVETVTVALFLLCFYHLPEIRNESSRLRFKATNLVISIGVGMIVTIIALSVNNHRLFRSISTYFEDSYSLAGAKNIVNAILVDFRGFDTMLEILVLCIAGLGVYTIIKLQITGREK